MSWFQRKGKQAAHAIPPPQWAPAPETSHVFGLLHEATDDEYTAAEKFCANNPPEAPRLLPSDVVDRIAAEGCRAWGIVTPPRSRFAGRVQNDSKGGPGVVRVVTDTACQDTCLLSDLPLMAGLYDIQGKTGMYYEIKINRMDGIIAVGTSCRPYPSWRLPGWNRLSAGLHLDDLRKFFEDPDGGRDYTDALSRIVSGDTIGCGYEFSTSSIFFTYNGYRLPPAFTGVYLPRHRHDVYAAIGVEGRNEFEVNFGGDVFRWKEANEWQWRVEGHVGRLTGSSGSADDELPAYSVVQ
ncbi:hypothetical protein SERLA73DRAFT_189097 [Serpula lacrymans var. lacrymans S7.3]|uniref:B30.2/SPRY domain-containing protein n=2 Tax=Serpula lacrymans var. lacrymans TaxID=341189 RepID=F8QCU7_SERL3|nr:uncharacterized protein SERLADRAFT_479769 [Serpula lacrymans var. lacrymans S7.9]EGN93962.1 hypothetical protein SERLA73DRAFT_189097 [Serpula lacrymans var. lacrymans S7.3]EGO19328.1 hypothetical protein SERLADRAFT_479769 [Serpula lacrymans var. lacrymans S7.9]